MTADGIVYWAVTAVIAGMSSGATGIAAWALKSHLALVREFDQFKGVVSSSYVTPLAVEKAVASGLAPFARDLEAQGRAIERQGRLLEKIAHQMHIPTVLDE